MYCERIAVFVLFFGSAMSFAQIPAPSPSPSPSVLSNLDLYVKIGGGVIAGIIALLGIPSLLLTYRKTRMEILKLELEADDLRKKQTAQADTETTNGKVSITVDRSPYTNVQVLADPRLLAPLLILLDFILASIVLTFASYLLSIFGLAELHNFVLAVIAAVLFLPIGRQVLRVRAILHPPRNEEEVRASLRQARVSGFLLYWFFAISWAILGTLLLTMERGGLTSLERYFAWGLISCSLLMVLLFPFAKNRFDRHLKKILESDTSPNF
jgi:hypothetical protein